jgi:thiamine-phosphate pyrophosphorylase
MNTKKINKLQYISQKNPFLSHEEAVQNALYAGCKWIQLRIKNTDEEEVRSIALKTKLLCDQHDAVLIINDYVKIAKEVDAHGVHVGLNDMSVAEARSMLGKEKIIGATANTIEQVCMHVENAPDYLGIGPFRFTQTKEKLSPVLGVDGYKYIINEMNNLGISIPVIAVGGITVSDLTDLIDTGIYGVAISGEINFAKDRNIKVHQLIQRLENQQ